MLIEPKTAAENKVVKVNSGQSISVRGTLVAENITLSIPDGAGGWVALSMGGSAVVLSATDNHLPFTGNILVRVEKPITTNLVGVTIV